MNMLPQTSSWVKMGFNYLLMEWKFNFPSQLASDFCTMQEICGLRWRTKSSLQECVWTWLKEERWEKWGRRSTEIRELYFERNYFGLASRVLQSLPRSSPSEERSLGKGGGWDAPLVLALLEEVDQWLDTPVPESPPQFIVNFIIFSRRIISSWMRH